MSDYPMLISNKLHSFRNFRIQKYIYFLNLQFFLQSFFLFYILSYQSDSLICTKNLLLLTNLLNAPKK